MFNAGDDEVLTIRQVVEVAAAALGVELELVSMPYDLAVPARPLLTQPLPTHRVLDTSRLRNRLGYRDLVPAREAVAHTARWLAEHPPEPGGPEETVLTDPFDYDGRGRTDGRLGRRPMDGLPQRRRSTRCPATAWPTAARVAGPASKESFEP